jgi:FAD/FMN-containing dehydrogenase
VTVDPAARTARAQGGALWSDVNTATAEHGLAVTGGAISSTGVAGFTLGGGLGWLMSTPGLGADNLTGVELVTATGEIVWVSDESHPDLMWALRGGGGNFGCRRIADIPTASAGDGGGRPDRPSRRGGRRPASLLP